MNQSAAHAELIATFRRAQADAAHKLGLIKAAGKKGPKAIQAAAPKPTDAQLQQYFQLNPQAFQSDPRIVAREIVVAHGGRIFVTGNVPTGSRFASSRCSIDSKPTHFLSRGAQSFTNWSVVKALSNFRN